MKLLAAADLHLGRALGSVPKGLASAYSPKVAWARLVDFAIEEAVDAVLLAGDVVDCDYSYFEAFGPLQRGLERLRGAGIPVVMVAGNHDVKVLPELVRGLADDGVTLLGESGCWEYVDLADRDGGVARIYGWSFPARHHEQSPFVDSFELGPTPPAIRIGLLHADYGVSEGDYAPVTAADFVDREVPLWAMGHVHLPQDQQPSEWVCCSYVGSLQALSPKEVGVRGALLIEAKSNGELSSERVPVGGLCYLTVELDAGSTPCTRDGVFAALREAIDEQLGEAIGSGVVSAVVVDVELGGESLDDGRDYERLLDELVGEEELLDAGAYGLRIRRRRVAVRMPTAALDLAALARGSDFKAMLAQILLELDENADEDPAAELLALVQELSRDVAARSEFSMASGSVSELSAAAIVERQVYALLRAVVAATPMEGEAQA